MSINITEFNNKFTTKISKMCNPDTTNMHLACIEFIVKCNVNGLFLYIEHGFDNADYVATASTETMFNDAFSAHATDIRDWATSVQDIPSVFGLYIPTTGPPTLGITAFNQEFSVNITRYEPYPEEAPSNIVVNFAILNSTTGVQQSIYSEAVLPIGTTTTQILDIAWEEVIVKIDNQLTTILNKDTMIGVPLEPTSFV